MSDFGDGVGSVEFGIDGYAVPRDGPAPVGYSVPRAKLATGGAFEEASKKGPAPGPCEYFKDAEKKKGFGSECRGGAISKLSRPWSSDGKAQAPTAAGKGLPKDSPMLTPRILGGPMARKDRGSYLFDKAVAQSRHQCAPGKYTPRYLEAAPRAASFGVQPKGKQSSRPGAQIGPGHYEIKTEACDKKLPSYSVPKNPAKSFLDTLTKHSGALPGPGHHLGQSTATKVEDRAGMRLHSARILADHVVTPRRAAGGTPRSGGTP